MTCSRSLLRLNRFLEEPILREYLERIRTRPTRSVLLRTIEEEWIIFSSIKQQLCVFSIGLQDTFCVRQNSF